LIKERRHLAAAVAQAACVGRQDAVPSLIEKECSHKKRRRAYAEHEIADWNSYRCCKHFFTKELCDILRLNRVSKIAFA
jgi:hypothetical protein